MINLFNFSIDFHQDLVVRTYFITYFLILGHGGGGGGYGGGGGGGQGGGGGGHGRDEHHGTVFYRAITLKNHSN